jgi:hypothetical protein
MLCDGRGPRRSKLKHWAISLGLPQVQRPIRQALPNGPEFWWRFRGSLIMRAGVRKKTVSLLHPASKGARRGPRFARCPHLKIEIWGTPRLYISKSRPIGGLRARYGAPMSPLEDSGAGCPVRRQNAAARSRIQRCVLGSEIGRGAGLVRWAIVLKWRACSPEVRCRSAPCSSFSCWVPWLSNRLARRTSRRLPRLRLTCKTLRRFLRLRLTRKTLRRLLRLRLTRKTLRRLPRLRLERGTSRRLTRLRLAGKILWQLRRL